MLYPTVHELFDLTGEVAIVTGGARNLGLQAAEALAEAGANVVVTSRTEATAVEAAAGLAAARGIQALGASLEVTDEASWDALVEKTLEAFGRIDILVNNTGLSVAGRSAHRNIGGKSDASNCQIPNW